MAEPSLSSSDPAGGDSDVFVNVSLKATFAATLTVSSVKDTTVLLVDEATSTIVDVVVDYDEQDGSVVTVTPQTALANNNVYTLKFPGTDTAVSSAFVISDRASGDVLTTTITITFTTGSRVYVDDTSIDKDATDLSLEGDLVLPVHVKALGEFAISGMNPKNHEADVAISLNGVNQVQFDFTKALSGDLCDSTWVTVDTFGILDSNQFLSVGDDLQGTSGTLPTVSSVSCTGNSLFVEFSEEVPQNLGIQIGIESKVTAADGSEFGPNDFEYSITTDRYPSIGGVHIVKRELYSIDQGEVIPKDYIAALLFQHTIELNEMVTNLNATNPSYLHQKWVLMQTLLDILEDKELEKAVVAGTRRQLGDLNVSVDSLIGKMSLKHARVMKELDRVTKGIHGPAILAMRYAETMLTPRKGTRLWFGVAGQLRNFLDQTYQGNYPAANIYINRQAKVPPDSIWI